MLERNFYIRDVNLIAKELPGKLLVHKTKDGLLSGMITEVEAYAGIIDKAAHSYNGRRTSRTEIMYAEGGYAYVYKIYGMYDCFNVVVNERECPQAILIRAVQPVEGIDTMFKNRGTNDIRNLTNGPGKLCRALEITREHYGLDLCGDTLYITEYEAVADSDIMVSPRINIDYAEEAIPYPWRYYLKDNPFVSKVPKRYAGRPLVP